jgi:hypothetical protein
MKKYCRNGTCLSGSTPDSVSNTWDGKEDKHTINNNNQQVQKVPQNAATALAGMQLLLQPSKIRAGIKTNGVDGVASEGGSTF